MDPAATEIMKNRFAALVEEAATVAYRTAHTTFVKQTQDFQVALARREGEFFAFPTMLGGTSSICQTIGYLTEPFMDDLHPGDVLISNDPYRTRGLVTHTMDIHLVRPIFYKGELMCFAWAFVHATDIGGAVPGSISPDNTEVFQEGIQIRPTKLVRAGQLNGDVVNFLVDNSRIGDEVWGDLQAMQSAMALLERRAQALCDKVGPKAFIEGVNAVMDHAERKARGVIAGLKDGVYRFWDYIETGGSGGDGATRIACTLTIKGDEAFVDYTGSDPQIDAALNFATGNRPHPFLCLALTNYIQTVEPSTPVNGGMMRPIHTYAPSGTIMNATFPAAMGNRWVAVMRTYDVLMGCLNQAIPEGLTACGAGQAGIISVGWTQVSDGRPKVSVVQPFTGGSGGRVCADGVDASDTMIGFLKSTPVEFVEVATPLLLHRHELVPDSFGHGRYRGGAAVCIEIECRAPNAIMTVRGMDRFRFQPWGILGGTAGQTGHTVLNPGAQEQVLGRIRVLHLKFGDVLRMVSPSGAGYGMPLDRPPEEVLRDVVDGMLSRENARDVYGVVLKDGKVDAEATAALRKRLAGAGQPAAAFSHGAERQRFETLWSDEVRSTLAKAVLDRPQGIRKLLHQAIQEQIRTSPNPPTTASIIDVADERARVLMRN